MEAAFEYFHTNVTNTYQAISYIVMNLETPNQNYMESVLAILSQGEAMLDQMTDDQYRKPAFQQFGGTMGGHYRHVLDHFQLLLNSCDRPEVNYDQRKRGTLVEIDRQAALAATKALRENFLALKARNWDQPMRVISQTNPQSTIPQEAQSTMGREVMYATAHATHHYAIIRLMTLSMDIKLPEDFGMAPSTIHHQRRESTIPSKESRAITVLG